jgi:hypothetical protein
MDDDELTLVFPPWCVSRASELHEDHSRTERGIVVLMEQWNDAGQQLSDCPIGLRPPDDRSKRRWLTLQVVCDREEVRIGRQQNPAFLGRQRQDFVVGQSLQTATGDAVDIHTSRVEGAQERGVDVFIAESGLHVPDS